MTMSSSASPLAAPAALPAADEPSTAKRVLILVMVVLGSTLYATTLLIASTLLPQMQGTMSATQDEIAWAMTFNILATAVATPMTGWLAARFGRRETMTWSVFLFTFTTLMCGLADSLETLILWRVLQGALGGLIFWILGIGAPLLWGVVMAFLSLLPVIGAGLVWLPVAIYLLATGAMWQGLGLIAFGTLVIGPC